MPRWSISRTQITINGQTYKSVEEMPPAVRQQYEQAMSMLADRDGNGVPDIVEQATQSGSATSHVTAVTRTAQRYVINGKEYTRWEDVPQEFREKLAGGHRVTEQAKPIHGSILEERVKQMECESDPPLTASLSLLTIVLVVVAVMIAAGVTLYLRR